MLYFLLFLCLPSPLFLCFILRLKIFYIFDDSSTTGKSTFFTGSLSLSPVCPKTRTFFVLFVFIEIFFSGNYKNNPRTFQKTLILVYQSKEVYVFCLCVKKWNFLSSLKQSFCRKYIFFRFKHQSLLIQNAQTPELDFLSIACHPSTFYCSSQHWNCGC